MVTVAILAQGRHWAVDDAHAFCMGSSPTLYSLCADVLRAAVLCADVLRAAVLCIAALRTAAALRAAICATAPRAVARFEQVGKGHIGSNVFQRFRYVSVNVSIAFPSMFTSRFRQRFRYVSVGQVCARWKLFGNSPSVSRAH